MQDPWNQLPIDRLAAIAAQVKVYAPSRLHKLIAAADNKASYFSIWQPGILHSFWPAP